MQILDQIFDMGTNVEKTILHFGVMSYGQRGVGLKEQSLVQVECHQDVLELFHLCKLLLFFIVWELKLIYSDLLYNLLFLIYV